MLALSVMKENRGHQQCGRPLRAAMTFGLWGDPTWKLPSGSGRLSRTDRVYAVRCGLRRGSRARVMAAGHPSRRLPCAEPSGRKTLGGLHGEARSQRGETAHSPILRRTADGRLGSSRMAVLSSKLHGSQWISLWDPAQPLALPAGLGQSRAGEDSRPDVRFRPALRPVVRWPDENGDWLHNILYLYLVSLRQRSHYWLWRLSPLWQISCQSGWPRRRKTYERLLAGVNAIHKAIQDRIDREYGEGTLVVNRCPKRRCIVHALGQAMPLVWSRLARHLMGRPPPALAVVSIPRSLASRRTRRAGTGLGTLNTTLDFDSYSASALLGLR